MVFLRTPYNYDVDAVSNETGIICPEPTLAQQQFKDETDINTIMERFGKTGQLPTDGVRMPQYGDFTGVSDYHSALNAVIAAEESFLELPAKIRARFDNDPGAFVEFCLNDENRAEAESLGLVAPKVTASAPTEPAPSPAGDGA